jgi:RimJ/RimL family protein N-acetyltransferase
VQFKHLTEFTDEDWFNAHQIMYDQAVMDVMGSQERIPNPPTLVTYYEYSIRAHERGALEGWLIYKGDEPLGYVLLDSSNGEWELGVAIRNASDRNRGVGIRAVLHALRWAFETKGVEWVTAFSLGTDTKVPRMLKKFGFRRLYHFWVLDKATWFDKWSGRLKNG